MNGKVEDWIDQIVRLSEFAKVQPQAYYAAFTFGLRHRYVDVFFTNTPRHRGSIGTAGACNK